MFLLRRAAARTLSHSTTRQLSTPRLSAPRILAPPSAKPSLSIRSFHQSRIWRAEEEDRKAEELKDDSVAAAEVAEDAAVAAQQAAEQAAEGSAGTSTLTSESAEVKEAQEVTEGESSVAAEAAADAASAAAAASTVNQPPPRTPMPNEQRQVTGQPSRVLYVGNLFFEVTAPQLEQEFSQCGDVVNSRIVADPRGLSKGFGYVEFADQSSADRAIKLLDQKLFHGRGMRVQYHMPRERRPRSQVPGGPPKNSTPSKTLFIGNMSYNMSDEDLNSLFREVRDVLDVRVAIDRRSGQPRGFAHADFIDVASAVRAKEHLEGKAIYGRQLRVDFSSSSTMTRT